MNESSRLVSDLLQKLMELDQKVAAYREDMTSEYTKYAESLLRNVPMDVSDNVKKVVAESLHTFPALDPESSASSAFKAEGSCAHILNTKENSAAPLPGMASREEEEEAEGPRSPHAREKEFEGVFTPSYLPLLDSNDRNERRSSLPTSPLTQSQPVSGIEIERTPVRPGIMSLSSSYSGSPRNSLPQPRRRNTEDYVNKSSSSSFTMPRSALRRSSGPSKSPQSPRTVRFEFEGEQFTTTSTPQPSSATLETLDTAYPERSLLDDSDDEAGSEQVEDVSALPLTKRLSSSEALRALSRGSVEDDGTQWTQVSAPPDGSASVEGSLQEDSDEEEDMLSMGRRKVAGNIPLNGDTASKNIGGDSQKDFSSGVVNSMNTLQEEPADEDDELAGMPELRPTYSRRSSSYLSDAEPTTRSVLEGGASPKAASSPSKTWLVEPTSPIVSKAPLKLQNDWDEEDEPFVFDEAPKRNSSRAFYLEESSDDSEDDAEDGITAGSGRYQPSRSISQYAQSPARTITQPKLFHSPPQPMGSVSNTSTNEPISLDEATPVASSGMNSTSKPPPPFNPITHNADFPFKHTSEPLQPGIREPLTSSSPQVSKKGASSGTSSFVTDSARTAPTATNLTTTTATPSFRNSHPWYQPTVNPAVHAEAAKMGNMSSFVGSVSGKSGVDASDLNSYRGSFGGSPGAGGGGMSLNDRMILEELMEERGKGKGKRGEK